MMAVFRVAALCTFVEVYRPFRGTLCFHQDHHHSPNDGGNKLLRNVCKFLPDYTALQLKDSFSSALLSYSYSISESSDNAVSYVTVKRAIDIRNRPRIPIPDEDPYSVAGSGGSSGSSGVGTGTSGTGNGTGMVAATREQLLHQQQQLLQRRSDKPPKLPPRDNSYPHDIPKVG
jgi:hypothetical protein